MGPVYEGCCGLDVHKKTVVACVRNPRHVEARSFGTMTRDVLALADWLTEHRVTHGAMESTGVYWKPIYNILEGGFTVLAVNAQHLKAVPGRKTCLRLAVGDHLPPLAGASCGEKLCYQKQMDKRLTQPSFGAKVESSGGYHNREVEVHSRWLTRFSQSITEGVHSQPSHYWLQG